MKFGVAVLSLKFPCVKYAKTPIFSRLSVAVYSFVALVSGTSPEKPIGVFPCGSSYVFSSPLQAPTNKGNARRMPYNRFVLMLPVFPFMLLFSISLYVFFIWVAGKGHSTPSGLLGYIRIFLRSRRGYSTGDSVVSVPQSFTLTSSMTMACRLMVSVY